MATPAHILDAISSRGMGQISVSIGTSLALEGAFGILEDAPNKNPVIDRVDVIYVNVRTLLRNFFGAFSSELVADLFPEDIKPAIETEMSVIRGAVEAASSGRVEVVYYACGYRTLSQRFPKAILKAATTDKQRAAAMREETALSEIVKYSDKSTYPIILSDLDLPKDPRRALLLSSYAVDLLQKYNFASLTLLESHTGAVKVQATWHTKLTNGKDLTMIPFDRMTLQMFGDGNLFTGYPIKVKRRLIEIATKYKWTPLTTKDYILSCIKKEHEPFILDVVTTMYKR